MRRKELCFHTPTYLRRYLPEAHGQQFWRGAWKLQACWPLTLIFPGWRVYGVRMCINVSVAGHSEREAS